MPDTCIRRRLLFACRETYQPNAPPPGGPVGWHGPPKQPDVPKPQMFTAASPHGSGNIDAALVGRIDEGILLAFRGTLPPFAKGDDHPPREVLFDWLNNAEFISRDNPLYPGRVHKGFAGSIDRLWGQIAPAIQALIRPGGRNTLFVTGHSKGGALANLAAWRALGISGLEAPIKVYSIAAARAGNEDFRAAYEAHGGIRCRRYESALDVVPFVPFGNDTPGWLKTMIRKMWPNLTDQNYVPVGTRSPLKMSWSESLEVVRRYAGWLGWGGTRSNYLPLIAVAHSIDGGSGYDALICNGEPGCTHD